MTKQSSALTYGANVRDYLIGPDLLMSIDLDYEMQRISPLLSFVEEHGQKFISGPFDYQYPAVGEGRCFDVAAEVAAAFGLHYCEGILHATTLDGKHVMMLHGWCVTSEGLVVDPVAYKAQETPEARYFGIPFRLSYAQAFKERFGFFGLLDGHPSLGLTVGVYEDPPELWKDELQLSALKV